MQERLDACEEYTPAEINRLVKFQYWMRCNWLPGYKTKFSRAILQERLAYERDFTFRFLFLFNQVAVFFLLSASLYLGGNDNAQQGLAQEIRDDFDFEHLFAVGSREAFVSESLPHIARARYSSDPD